MKYFSSLFTILSLAICFSACEKAETLPFYPEGKDFTLNLSSTSVVPAMADSNNRVLNLTWTSPEYPMDESRIKFVVEVDLQGNSFKNPITKTVIGAMDTGFLAKELNAFAVSHTLEFEKAHQFEARVISSYENNNDRKTSNTAAFSYTPYLVPPEVAPPSSKELWIVGSSTVGGWDNPVPVSQKFTMIDTVTYEGTFFLKGGGEYLLLPVNGDWSHKYNVVDAGVPGLAEGGDFAADAGSANIPGPAETGYYKMVFDFQLGKFTVTKVGDYAFLYMPGDYQGWSPATAPALGSPDNNGKFAGFVNVPSGGSYEFKFTPQPNWDNSYGDGGPGKISTTGGNLVFPGGGYYYITANTASEEWSITPITAWGVIGSFAGSGWGSDVPMNYDGNAKRWDAVITVAEGDQFKFRANNDWGLNLGADGSGRLSPDGPNIGDGGANFALSAGTYLIYLYIESSGYYTYSVIPQ